ncbi:DUF1992 domain-containing protein [Allokutzneria sp. A3M-2-11 16]|uniref:DnaJ family domain-containing protein n=1 Tax=Allokutzneria sp. A3M-2-11 16 TaxID=2962043 RepID=UPI0020B81815|nr:DUF1992 domain-containing protein [Allokutzneria sp. A3M-2-11 16]MCP3802153.1 DUF1992 domain-containing protein [Allokutzneria sp. A3M-2-11 16]
MTERKPAGTSFETWIDQQVREAEERGEMTDLPGHGKPIPQRNGGTMEWVAEKLRKENVDTSALLPPSLALAKEVEDLPKRLAGLRSEAAVRELVLDLNERIRKAQLAPQIGPPMRTRQVDVETTIATWHARR